MIDPVDNLYKDLLVKRGEDKIFSKHVGYLNLFPFFFGLVDSNSTEMEAII